MPDTEQIPTLVEKTEFLERRPVTVEKLSGKDGVD